MPYIANKPGTAFRSFTHKDTFTGDGSTVAFDMTYAIGEAGQNDLQIFVNDVRQIPGDDYSLGRDDAGDYKRVTFTSAPTNSHAIVILNPGTVQGEFSSVADNSVTSAKLNTTAYTGHTELAEAPADDDVLTLYDTSADSIKKIQNSNLVGTALITGKTALGEGAATDDLILIYDTSAGVLKKVTQTNLLNFPTVTSVSPTNAVSGDGTGNYTFVITGSGFTGATATLLTSGGTSISFDSQTIDSDTQITGVVAKNTANLTNANEPFGVKVTAGSGLASTLAGQISIDAQPVWSTASGSLATVFDSARTNTTYTLFASDPESGGDVTYTLESGSLPSGLSGASQSSGYVISGTPNAVGSDTTSTFTIRAKDVNSNTTDREFSITIKAPSVTSFTTSGTFSVPSGITAVDVLVVAGGGAGGRYNSGSNFHSGAGGGGAGGLIYRPGFPVTPGGTVTVTVGNGGAGDNAPVSGQNSVFGTLTAQGGGRGASGALGQPTLDAASGGSGGGTSRDSTTAGSGTQSTQPGDSGTYGFGNPGGPGIDAGPASGGGGGGAGAAGTAMHPSTPGGRPGGIGKAYSISGTSVYYAGGGGGGGGASGGEQPGGSGGNGGGGDGGNAAPTTSPNAASQDATPNRGGGGGGAGANGPSSGNPTKDAGAGGKGIVIVAY